MNFKIFFLGVALGMLSWALVPFVSDSIEPFDSDAGFYVGQLILSIPAFYIAFSKSYINVIKYIIGIYVGFNVYSGIFITSGFEAMAVLAITSLFLCIYPLLFTWLGVALKSLYDFANNKIDVVGLVLQKKYEEGYNAGYSKLQEIRDIEKSILFETKLAVGSKVICVGNEWQELVVGAVEGLFKDDIPLVKDEVSATTVLCMGVILPYDYNMLMALAKLNPFERYSLVIAWKANNADQYIFNKKKSYDDNEDPVKLLSMADFELLSQRF